jgi:hypothetical protein
VNSVFCLTACTSTKIRLLPTSVFSFPVFSFSFTQLTLAFYSQLDIDQDEEEVTIDVMQNQVGGGHIVVHS